MSSQALPSLSSACPPPPVRLKSPSLAFSRSLLAPAVSYTASSGEVQRALSAVVSSRSLPSVTSACPPPPVRLKPSIFDVPSSPSSSSSSSSHSPLVATAIAPPQPSPSAQPSRAERFAVVCKELRISDIKQPESVLSELKSILFELQDAFSASDLDLGRTQLTRHTILTVGEPFREKLRQVPYARRSLVKTEIDHLLRLGVIVPATPGECPYASAIVLVKKKDGSIRLCVDYRRLNAQTIKDAYNLPRIDDLLQQLSRARYFVALDLLMGYHQIEVAPEDQSKTAFVCCEGLFVYKVMPFGLCNAPATFQRLMNSVLAEHIGRDCVVYIDDVLIFAADPASLLRSLQSVLRKLIAAGLKCKSRKCSLFTTQILYLGFVIADGTIGPDPAKIEKIVNWPVPKSGNDIASFLGLCNYYRSLAPELANIADVLYQSVNEKSLEWTSSHQSAFESIKSVLSSKRIVHLPDTSRSFILETDASEIALGAVLKQTFTTPAGDPVERPVSFYSKSLTATERRYSTYERELLAVVKATHHYRVFLLGRFFTVRTDHAALRSIFRGKLRDTARIERWILALSPFVFDVEAIPGRENVVADALSRVSWPALTEGASDKLREVEDSDDDGLFVLKMHSLRANSQLPTPALNTLVNSLNEHLSLPAISDSHFSDPPSDSDSESSSSSLPIAPDTIRAPTLAEFAEAQSKERELCLLKQWIEAGEAPNPALLENESPFLIESAQNLFRFKIEFDCVLICDEDGSALYKMLVPPALRNRVIDFFHSGPMGAHEGHKKVCARVTAYHYWPLMKRDVRLRCARCDVCELFRSPGRSPRSPLQPLRVGFRGQLVALDVVGGGVCLEPCPEGFRYWLTIIDVFTKFAVAVPLVLQDAPSICRAFLFNWILRFGAPLKVLTDQGRAFESKQFSSLCLTWRVRKLRTTAFHPQCNGACERLNQTLKHSLAKLMINAEPSSWPHCLPLALFCYNSSVHSSTGFTPFFLTFGCEARAPTDVLFPPAPADSAAVASALTRALSVAAASAREHLRSSLKREKDWYDSGITSRIFHVGQSVRVRLPKPFRRTGSKLLPAWDGPFIIHAVRGVNLQIHIPKNNKLMWIHADRASNPIWPKQKSESDSHSSPQSSRAASPLHASRSGSSRSHASDSLHVSPSSREQSPRRDSLSLSSDGPPRNSPVHAPHSAASSPDLSPMLRNPTRSVITRYGRTSKPNRRDDFVYFQMMAEQPIPLPADVTNRAAWTKVLPMLVKDAQQPFRFATALEANSPLHSAFLDRRTGTLFIWQDAAGCFMAAEKVPAGQRAVVYAGADTVIPDSQLVAHLFTTLLPIGDCLPLTITSQAGVSVVPLPRWPVAGGPFGARCYGRSAAWNSIIDVRRSALQDFGARAPAIHYNCSLRQWTLIQSLSSSPLLSSASTSSLLSASQYEFPRPEVPPPREAPEPKPKKGSKKQRLVPPSSATAPGASVETAIQIPSAGNLLAEFSGVLQRGSADEFQTFARQLAVQAGVASAVPGGVGGSSGASVRQPATSTSLPSPPDPSAAFAAQYSSLFGTSPLTAISGLGSPDIGSVVAFESVARATAGVTDLPPCLPDEKDLEMDEELPEMPGMESYSYAQTLAIATKAAEQVRHIPLTLPASMFVAVPSSDKTLVYVVNADRLHQLLEHRVAESWPNLPPQEHSKIHPSNEEWRAASDYLLQGKDGDLYRASDRLPFLEPNANTAFLVSRRNCSAQWHAVFRVHLGCRCSSRGSQTRSAADSVLHSGAPDASDDSFRGAFGSFEPHQRRLQPCADSARCRCRHLLAALVSHQSLTRN